MPLTLPLLLLVFVGSPGGAQDKAPPDKGEKPSGKVFLTYDAGGHTAPIVALGFSRGRSELVTVGLDRTIQVWDVPTGARHEVLRLPAVRADTPVTWDAAAVSPDGRLVAVGGEELAPGARAVRMMVVDRDTKASRAFGGADWGRLTAVAFSPDGTRLAGAFHAGKGPARLAVWSGMDQFDKLAGEKEKGFELTSAETGHQERVTALAFTRDGARLALGGADHASIWDVPAPGKGRPREAHKLDVGVTTRVVAWSPDGGRLLVTTTGRPAQRGVQLWDKDGKQVKKWSLGDLAPTYRTSAASNVFSTQFLADDQVLVTGDVSGDGGPGTSMCVAGVLSLADGKCLQKFSEASSGRLIPLGAVGPNGRLAATTVANGLEVVVWRLKDGGGQRRMGRAEEPAPYKVAWSRDPAAPAFAWGSGRPTAKAERELRWAFDLKELAPRGELRPADFSNRTKAGDWSFQRGSPTGNAANSFQVLNGDKPVGTFSHPPRISAVALLPSPAGEPRVAWAPFGYPGGGWLQLSRADAKEVLVRFTPNHAFVLDVAPSPDGRFLLAATGTHRLCVYAPTQPTPLLNFLAVGGEWVAWTEEGYFAASPGGEKLIGWTVNNAPARLASFYPAERFRKHFHRPDVIKLVIEKGSVAEALKAAGARPVDVETVLPPTAGLTLLRQDGKKVVVKARAAAGSKTQPVEEMRLLLDGRSLPESRGVAELKPGEAADREWEIEVPPGVHELKLFARGSEAAAVSAPLYVTTPLPAADRPALHRVCVGIDNYAQKGLELSSARADAKAVFAALEQSCAGKDNLFREATGKAPVLDATRDDVIKALREARKQAKPGDLLVVFFAGHGVKQGNEYYLLTKEADTTKPLKDRSISGADLRAELATGKMPCPVLLLLDACHTANAVRAFKPPTDDLSRSLTEDQTAVTVMGAAMAHEVAAASKENGYFTQALLAALKAAEGVPFDHHERQMYVHHVYSHVFSQVRRLSGGKQNPFLNMPWTVPPLPVRLVPKAGDEG